MVRCERLASLGPVRVSCDGSPDDGYHDNNPDNGYEHDEPAWPGLGANSVADALGPASERVAGRHVDLDRWAGVSAQMLHKKHIRALRVTEARSK